MKKSLLSVTAIALGVTTLFGVTVAAASNASELAVKVNATSATLTFSAIGSSLTSTANTTMSTLSLSPTQDSSASYTFNYLQGKKQGDAILFAKGTGAFIANATPIPGAINSVTVGINSGASGKTTYHCAFSTTACTSAYTTGSTAVNIAGGNSHKYDNTVSDARYFCISLGNANNGQVLSITVDYESSSSGSTEATPSAITLNKTTAEMSVGGDTLTLTPTVTMSDSSTYSGDITWLTSDSSIATVSNGVVTAVAGGTVTITAKAGTKTASCTITIANNTTIQNAYESCLALTSSAATTAKYSFTGVVTAVAKNSFFLQDNGYGIYVYNTNAVTGLAVGKTVTVTNASLQKYSGWAEATSVGSITVDGDGTTPSPVSIASYDEFSASKHNITFSAQGLTYSSTKTVASSSATGYYLLSFGGTEVTLKVDKYVYNSEIGTKLAAMIESNVTSIDFVGAVIIGNTNGNQINITDASQIIVNVASEVAIVTDIALNKSSLTMDVDDGSQTLQATVTMSDGSAYAEDIEWTSSCPAVATVANGVVTPIIPGTTTITATAGTKSVSCEVTVTTSATYSLLAQYDFSSRYDNAEHPTAAYTTDSTSTAADLITTAISESFVSSSGTDIITGVTESAYVYPGTKDYESLGIKLGTSSNNGVLTFTTSSEVSKIVVQTAGWKATDSLIVGGVSQTPGVAYTASDCTKEFTYYLNSATTVSLEYKTRGFIKSIALYGVEEDTPVVPEGFAINAPSEVDYLSETAFSYYNLPADNTGVYAWLTTDSSSTSTNYPDDALVDNYTSTTPSIMTTLTEGTLTFYIQAYYTDALYQPVYATPVLVTVNYGLSNYVTDFELIRTDCNNGINVEVDSLKSNWSYMEEYWGDLSADEQKTFKNTAADATAATSTLANTVALYDLIVAKYSVNNFANRAVSAGAPVVRSFVESTTTTTAIVTVAAISSITLVGGLTLAKKRKED